MKRIVCLIIVSIFLLNGASIFAQQDENTAIDNNKNTAESEDLNSNIEEIENEDSTSTRSSFSDSNRYYHKDIMRYTALFGMPPAVFLFGVKAWDWDKHHSWRNEKEGWFQHDTSFGGADKAGHFMAHYIVQRTYYDYFNYTENGRWTKWLYSAGSTMAFGLIIEIGDGFSSNYGFSTEDLIIDYVGAAVGVILDYFPEVDYFIDFSFEYIPTHDFRNYDGDHPNNFLATCNDYSGWKYMMNFRLAGFRKIGFDTPDFFDYISIDFGYYTKGYSVYDSADMKETRHIYAGFSINMMEVVDDIFGNKQTLANTATQRIFKYYRLPLRKDYDYNIDK